MFCLPLEWQCHLSVSAEADFQLVASVNYVMVEIKKALFLKLVAPPPPPPHLSQYSAHEDSAYDEVKLAIRRRFAVNAETYHQRLRATKFKMGDDVTELAVQVYTLTDRWLQGSEDKMERVALEQYYNAIPREIAEWLRDQQPATLMAERLTACNSNG